MCQLLLQAKNIIFLAVLIIISCNTSENQEFSDADFELGPELTSSLTDLMTEYKSPSMAIGLIKNGKLVETQYFGKQSPGKSLNAESMFNTASVQKAITSETIIRLVEKGLVNLDESLSKYYVHPDIKDDPRHLMLTPRIILTHRTGFLNWPHNYSDGKLAFEYDPGESYGYSGIGFMILANAVEKKLNKPWPAIVKDEIFDPIGMTNASVIQESWMDSNYVHPSNSEGGFELDFALDYGYWNSADDLYVTVEDYAKFLIAVAENRGIGDELAEERVRVQSDLTKNEIWGCDGIVDPCPAPFGHGLGWFVFGYDGILNIQHGGNDQTEAAIAYIEPETGNGAIVFVNSTQGVLMWPKVVDIIDQKQQFTKVFHHVIAKYLTPSE